jgi:hypothetical protein
MAYKRSWIVGAVLAGTALLFPAVSMASASAAIAATHLTPRLDLCHHVAGESAHFRRHGDVGARCY